MKRRIVVGYDGTLAARAALDRAIGMTRDGHAWEIVLVCTHERPADFRNHPMIVRPKFGHEVPAEAWIEEWAGRVTADMNHAACRVRLAGVDASAACTLDDPAELMTRVANETKAHCVVVADDRGGALHDLVLGSLTRRLLRRCRRPVVVVAATEEMRRSA